MFPLNESGMVSGLLCGILFGYVLENAGFGSPVKLSAQFKLTDWAVFKVMFTAIVVAAVGLALAAGLAASIRKPLQAPREPDRPAQRTWSAVRGSRLLRAVSASASRRAAIAATSPTGRTATSSAVCSLISRE